MLDTLLMSATTAELEGFTLVEKPFAKVMALVKDNHVETSLEKYRMEPTPCPPYPHRHDCTNDLNEMGCCC